LIIYFVSPLHFIIKYATGAAIKIDENEPESTQNIIVKAKRHRSPVQKIYIAITTNNVANDVQSERRIVCRNESSKISAILTFVVAFARFSLIRSKIIIVSLILYHIVVRSATINITSTCAVVSNMLLIPYTHIGDKTSKSIVMITIVANTSG
jgi:hypothetical protein